MSTLNAKVKMTWNLTGIGHQLRSEEKHIRSVKECLEQSLRDFKYITPTTEVLDIKKDLNEIILKLDRLACAAEEQINQNI